MPRPTPGGRSTRQTTSPPVSDTRDRRPPNRTRRTTDRNATALGSIHSSGDASDAGSTRRDSGTFAAVEATATSPRGSSDTAVASRPPTDGPSTFAGLYLFVIRAITHVEPYLNDGLELFQTTSDNNLVHVWSTSVEQLSRRLQTVGESKVCS